MEKLPQFFSIVKQRTANLIGLQSNEQVDISQIQALPLINKDLLSKFNINHGIAIKSDEQQSFTQMQTKNRVLIIRPFDKNPSTSQDNVAISTFHSENLPKLCLLKFPSRLSYINGWQTNKCVCIMEEIVDKNLHTTLTNMQKQLGENYTFPPHETIALDKLFKRQLKDTEWQKSGDLIYEFKFFTRKNIPVAEEFHLLKITPSTGKTINQPATVHNIDYEPIVESQKCFSLMNFTIALCFLLQWPAYAWSIHSGMGLLAKRNMEIEVEIAVLFISIGFFITPAVFLYTFMKVNTFIKKLFIVRPKHAIRLQLIRFVTAILILFAQAGYPVIKHCFQLAPFFVYIFPNFVPRIIIAIVFLVNILLLLILPCVVNWHILHYHIWKYEEIWNAKEPAICSKWHLPEQLWNWMQMDTNTRKL